MSNQTRIEEINRRLAELENDPVVTSAKEREFDELAQELTELKI